MSLYLKYRPKTLEEMEGNEGVMESLSSVLAKQDKPRAFLFTGPSGTGKTTCARIMKTMLGCSDADYKETDSADFRGVDTVREIRHNMVYRPANGPCRIFYLDEVHQMTKDAQNALLKALEDTPSHVFFILATTELEKLLPTIRTRCSIFQMALLPDRRIIRLMQRVVKLEKKVVPDNVLSQIALDSMGSPRMALVILDKIIDLDESMMLKSAEQSASQESKAIELCRVLLARKKWKDIGILLKSLEGEDPEKLRRMVLKYCSSVLLGGDNAQAFLILASFKAPFYDSGMAGLVCACYECTVS